MKRIIAVFAAVSAFMLMAGCENAQNGEDTETSAASAPDSSTLNLLDTSEAAEEPFSEYTLEVRGTKNNYMAVIRKGEQDGEISVTVENNLYESKEYVITAPEGYDFIFPSTQKMASSVVNVIQNDIDDTPIPDIMQFIFRISQDELDNNPDNSAYAVSLMYIIDDNDELKCLDILTPADEEAETPEEVTDILDRTQLYHSEPDKFIFEISVDDTNLYDEDGDFRPVEKRVKIRTLTYDSSGPRLLAGYEPVTEKNPLYFGYAYWAAANSAAQFFTMTTLNVTDYDNYIERTDDSGSTEYYFKINDSRFEDCDDLMDYLKTIFGEATAARIFSEAPQKYTDIDGELYGIVGDGPFDFSLGTLTFSEMEISENKMLFRSRQEKFDEDGIFTGYTDGGNFVISRQEDGIWRVIQYRYPYTFN